MFHVFLSYLVVVRILYAISLLLVVLTGFSQEEEKPYCRDISHLIECEQRECDNLMGFTASERTGEFDWKYIRFEWEVDPAIYFIAGTVTSYFTSKSDTLTQLFFDMEDTLVVDSVVYHGVLVDYELKEDRLKITLPDTIRLDMLDSIAVTYHGKPHSNGFGSFQLCTHDGSPVLWTLSEPYGAKTWWPTKESLSDKIDSIDVIVTTPMPNKVGTNGLLVKEESLPGDKIRYHWKHRYPIVPYLISLAVTNYVEFTDYVPLEDGDSLPILNYIYPEYKDTAALELKATVEQMKYFMEILGPYPFEKEKYGHAQFGRVGGMEHQTMSSMGSFSYGIQAHELAHQWFGNKVTCGAWEDIWINEGFATYLTALCYENLLPDSTWWEDWKINRIAKLVNAPWGSTWVDDTTTSERIFNARLSYFKGALILHMLRWKIGDEAFFNGMYNFVNDPSLSYSFARTKDLIKHFELTSGVELEEFFKDWFYSRGIPTYEFNVELNGTAASVEILQYPLSNKVDFYEMPLPLQFWGEGKDTLIRVDHFYSGQLFEFDLAFEVDSVVFDPDHWILQETDTIKYVTGLDEHMIGGLNVRPTLVDDILVLEIKHTITDAQGIYITDVQGKLMMQSDFVSERMNIDVAHFKSGQYMVALKREKGVSVHKFKKL